MGHVYAVEDLVRGGPPIALKVTPLASPAMAGSGLEALRTEFQTLAAIRHPNILRVLDFGLTGGTSGVAGAADGDRGWYFTSELISGKSFVAAAAETAPGEIVPWAIQVADALAHLHARGILHRDVKPDNLLVDGTGGVKLVDFGLAAGGSNGAKGGAAGTADYIAPEVIHGARADERSDLYAFGGVLYHALTRRPPFVGADAAAVLRLKTSAAPDPPSRHRPGIPPVLEALVLDLLAAEPEKRPTTAAAVRDQLVQLGGEAGAAILDQPAMRESRLRLDELFERDSELNALERALGQVLEAPLDSHPSRVVIVAGEAGSGKTRLLRTFGERAALAGVPVIEGASAGSEAGIALGPIARIALQAEALADQEMRAAYAPLLLRLRGGKASGSGAALPPAAEKLRLAHDITNFLVALAARQPMVVRLPDLEDCDETTLAVAHYLLRNPGAGRLLLASEVRTPVVREDLELLCTSARTATAPASGSRGRALYIELAPLAPAGAAGLVDAVLGDGKAPVEVRSWILDHTGLPVVIVEALRALVRDGVLRLEHGEWTVEGDLPTDLLSQGASAIVGAKYAGIPMAAELALRLVAAATVPLPGAILARAARQMESDLDRGAWTAVSVAAQPRALVRDHLLVALGGGDTQETAWTFPSRLEQAVFLARVPPDDLRIVHRALARAYAQLAPVPEILAHHHAEAGEGARAVPHALRAARRAERLSSQDAARKWYALALQFTEDREERRRIQERLGEVCRRSGLYAEAVEHFTAAIASLPEGAAADATSPANRARARWAGRLHDLLGQVHLDCGDFAAAESAFHAALSLLGDFSPVRRPIVLVNLAWVHLYRGEREPAEARVAAALTATRPPGVRQRALSCRAALHISGGELVPAAAVYSEVLAIARAIGDRVTESSALNNLGVAKSMSGDVAAAVKCWEASLALRRMLRYFRGVAECLNNLGIAHYTTGQPAAALESYGEALAITRQIGDRRGEGLAELNLGESYIDLSLYAQALEHSERSRAIAESIGDRDLTLRSLVQLGGIRARTGETEKIAELRGVLARHDPGADPFGRGSLSRVSGLEAALRGTPGVATGLLSSAIRDLTAAGESRLAAETVLDLADLAIHARAAGEGVTEEIAGVAREALAAFNGSPAAAVAERSAVLRARRALIEAELVPETDPEAVLATLTDAIAAAELAECRELAGRGRLILGDSLSGKDPGQAMGEYHRALAHLEKVVGEGPAASGGSAHAGAERARAGLAQSREALAAAQAAPAMPAPQPVAQATRETPAPVATAEPATPLAPVATPAGSSVATPVPDLADAITDLLTAPDRMALARLALAAVLRQVGSGRALVALAVTHRPGAYEVVTRDGEFTSADLALVLAALRAQKDDVLAPAQHLLGQAATADPTLSAALAALFEAGSSSVITVPIPAPGMPGIIGFIYVDATTSPATLGEPRRAALAAVARAFSHGLAAAEERHGLNAKLQHITRLYEISSSPVHTLDVEGVIDRSMEAMIQLTRAERGFLFLIENDGIQFKVARGADGKAIKDPTLEVSWSIMRKVVDERRAVRVDDALSDRLLSSSMSVVDLSLRSVMCIPIRSTDRLIGVAYVDNRSRTGQFNDDDLHVFELFGHQIAAALANAMTYAQVDEANRLKAEFLSNISHELRTPLTAILGFAHCLRQHPLPEAAGEQVAKIEESSEVLKELVDRVLTFSALESNQLPVESTPFAVSGLVAELRSRFMTQAATKGLDLGFEIAPEVPARITGDRDRLAEALRNLVDNAIKFTPEGRAGLTIEVEGRGVGEVTLRFTVEDSGIGIAGGDQGKVLDPFVQGDGSSTRRFGGMGLGLTTSARLVKVLGGRLELQSVPGQGTSVWFSLRFSLPEDRDA